MRGGAPRARAGLAAIGASALLHAAALAGLLMATAAPEPASVPEAGVALIWDRQEEGAGDAVDIASLAVPAPPAPPPPPAPAAPALPPSAMPPIPAEAPPVIATSPPAPGPVSAAPVGGDLPTSPPAPPLPPRQVAPSVPEAAPPLPVPDPSPAAPLAEELPPPPPPAPPRQVARAEPAPRPVQPPPSRPAAAPAEAAPTPQATGAGLVLGPVTPPRPREGVNNPPPEYPQASRRRGEEGRVRMVVRVNPEGRVVHVAVIGSSGFPSLDEAAERAVRRWRFEPATRDGQPVFSSLPLSVSFQLEGGRRW